MGSEDSLRFEGELEGDGCEGTSRMLGAACTAAFSSVGDVAGLSTVLCVLGASACAEARRGSNEDDR